MRVMDDAYKLMKQRRQNLGLTGAEVGRRMGLKTTQHYWNLENGKNKLTLEYAFLAAKALDVNVKFFCDDVKGNV